MMQIKEGSMGKRLKKDSRVGRILRRGLSGFATLQEARVFDKLNLRWEGKYVFAAMGRDKDKFILFNCQSIEIRWKRKSFIGL